MEFELAAASSQSLLMQGKIHTSYAKKICDHGLRLRNMEENFEFLFLARFMQAAGTIQKSFPHFVPIMQHTVSGESVYGAQLVDVLNDLLPCTVHEDFGNNYQLPHDAIQRELDQLLSERHDESFDLT